MDAPPTVPEPENPADAIPAADRAKCSGVRGVTGTDGREKPTGQPSGETLTLKTIVPAAILSLVNGLRPLNPASGEKQTGRALLEFCQCGFTLHRSTLGIREQASRRRKGRPVNNASGKSGQSIKLNDVDVRQHAATGQPISRTVTSHSRTGRLDPVAGAERLEVAAPSCGARHPVITQILDPCRWNP
jgi:hypothetical protein